MDASPPVDTLNEEESTTRRDPPEGLTRARRGHVGRFVLVLALVLVVAVLTLYGWPLRSDELQRAVPETLSFAAASERATRTVSADAADPEVRPDCRSQFLSHGSTSAKAVLLLHGYTGCPTQYRALAKLFFDRGYNVWVPRAPRHGFTDRSANAKLDAVELVDYANDALNVAAGLGDSVGVVGVSGGAVLATWLVGHRPDAVHRAVLLSPLYKPGSAQVPGPAVKPLVVLVGSHLVPARANSDGVSIAGLSQYLRVVGNFATDPRSPHLRELAVVTSENDEFIDRQAAVDIPRDIAERNDTAFSAHELPRELGVGHDIVDPNGLRASTDDVNRYYLDLYEGVERPDGRKSLSRPLT
ncbi:alpha/beta fold hydrolase [Micromonospora sp. NPDC051543]|uniref:alpha/beta fold hydrolase n=1 Tax=Micromonospora sp. NPDC051543 TaxID=3364287 RepID=UPI0037937639